MPKKEIGAVICNYNKKDYVLQCIASLQKQTYQNMDIYVVDNVSTGGSADAISDTFDDRLINLIEKNVLGDLECVRQK